MLQALVARTSLKSSGTARASLLRWSHTLAASHVPVVVVGAGPTGLVLSCLLSQYGVHSSQPESGS
jgi:ribulose 1,5-bisphosphate synthetase/thiazole synthase